MNVRFVRATVGSTFEKRLQAAYEDGYHVVEYKVTPHANGIIYTAVLESGRPTLTPLSLTPL